jgi:hypothetical protein
MPTDVAGKQIPYLARIQFNYFFIYLQQMKEIKERKTLFFAFLFMPSYSYVV